MIVTKVTHKAKEIGAMKKKLLLHGADSVRAEAIIQSMEESQALYLSALIHLAKSYILFHPKYVENFKKNKIDSFWAITVNSLYDSGVLYLCGLFDMGTRIKFKNLMKLNKNFDYISGNLEEDLSLPPQFKPIYERLKTYRDKRIAHFEYSFDAPNNWEDPVVLAYLCHSYLVKFHKIVFGVEFLLDTLWDEAKSNITTIHKSVGSNLDIDQIQNETLDFFTRITEKNDFVYSV